MNKTEQQEFQLANKSYDNFITLSIITVSYKFKMVKIIYSILKQSNHFPISDILNISISKGFYKRPKNWAKLSWSKSRA